ncbi:MAG TPA: hypothetical protein VEO73_10430 [Gemmatimonadales bacterium]|nr:hypothetical protein [Gemmatimonadales bacterium]
MNDHEHDAEFRDLLEEARRLPRSIEPPRDLWPGIRGRIRAGSRETGIVKRWLPAPLRRWVQLAVAAVLLLVVARNLMPRHGWIVEREAGRPQVGARPLAVAGRVQVGEWIVTDDSSIALVRVGRIGRVAVKPGSRVQVLAAGPSDHRLALARGTIDAVVDAPPRLFFVETPSGTAVDLGCAYTLEVDSLGNSRLHVTAGYVQFEWSGRRSIVPLGAVAETRRGRGPGVPYVADAPLALRRALEAFDFGNGGAAAVRTALASARPEDALSLWHLLFRVDGGKEARGAVYDRLAVLVPPPPGVTRSAALKLDSATVARYWEDIRRIVWRREILRGIRDIDSRTGTGRSIQTSPGLPASHR